MRLYLLAVCIFFMFYPMHFTTPSWVPWIYVYIFTILTLSLSLSLFHFLLLPLPLVSVILITGRFKATIRFGHQPRARIPFINQKPRFKLA